MEAGPLVANTSSHTYCGSTPAHSRPPSGSSLMTQPTPSHRLSKSRFVTGRQCPKLLWWKAHEPGAKELEPNKVLQDRFDQGEQVGAMARDRFGDRASNRLPLQRGGRHDRGHQDRPRRRCPGHLRGELPGRLRLRGGGRAAATWRRLHTHRGEVVVVPEARAHSRRGHPDSRAPPTA